MYNNQRYNARLQKKIQKKKRKFRKNIKLLNTKFFKKKNFKYSKPYECNIKPYFFNAKINNNRNNNNPSKQKKLNGLFIPYINNNGATSFKGSFQAYI